MNKTLLSLLFLCGTVSSQANLFQYSVALDGPTEGTPSLGVGGGLVNYDDSAHTLNISVTFSGLGANVTAAHIHAATAAPFTGTTGVAVTAPTLPGFPVGGTSGSYTSTLDLSLATSFSAGFVSSHGGTLASAEASLASAMADGKAYLNIHTTQFPGGEIRGFLTPVPEPATLALAGLGAAIIGVACRSRRSVS